MKMKRILSRTLSLVLVCAIILLSLSNTQVFASNTVESEVSDSEETISETTAEVNESDQTGEGTLTDETQSATKIETEAEIETETETSEVTEPGLLNYIYVESPALYTPGTQKIAVSVGEEDILIDSAVLRYQMDGTSEVLTVNAETIENNLLVFSIDFPEGTQASVYSLTGITYSVNGETFDLDFNEAGTEPKFGVNMEYGVESETDIDPEDVEMEVVTIDEDGNETSQNSIEDTIESAKSEVVSLPLFRSATTNLVVVLDPGHDATHTGASGNGLDEHVLTLKIAQYCKAELEEYQGVTVYMTRTTASCAYSGSDVSDCTYNRVAYAKSVGADVFVSIHLNSSTSSSAAGAEVWYPNSNYNASVGQEGKELAQKILDELVALGLADRGIKIRNSENGSTYVDGTLADYYAVINKSKLAGFPGIIIEHAFLTNASDAAYLKSEANLKKLGVADATGIASYYKLSKESPKLTSTPTITASGDSTETKFTLKAENVSLSTSMSGLKFAVWSQAGGQDDLIWYGASEASGGIWTKTIPISNHKTAGTYNVHTYAVASNGAMLLVGSTTFFVSSPSAGSVTVQNMNAAAGTFDIIVSGATAKSGVSKVMIPVWSTSNQSDIYWYTATKQSDGTYKVTANLSKHKYNYGTYKIHVYVTDNNQIQQMVKSTTQEVSVPTVTITASGNSTQTTYTLNANNVTLAGGVKSLKFAVWSVDGGQDDLIWYDSTQVSSGKWQKSISISSHKTAGKYNVHVYAVKSNGSLQYMGQTTFSVTGPSASSVSMTNVSETKGTFDVVVSGATSTSGVSKVQVPVWSKSDQSDIKWYAATKQSDGTYKVSVDIANHKYNYGKYNIHVYVTDNNGIRKLVVYTSQTLSIPTPTITATGNTAQTTYTVSAKNVALSGGVKNVKFAVWSAADGQDDLAWYSGSQESQGNWSYNVSISKHKTAGTYYVHVYATNSSGSLQFLGNTTFVVDGPSLNSVSVQNLNSTEGTFDIIVKGATSASGISSVKVPVWSKSDQSDIKWYVAAKQTDGTYKVTVNIANHKYNIGKYYIHVYITDGNNIQKLLGNTTTELDNSFLLYTPNT